MALLVSPELLNQNRRLTTVKDGAIHGTSTRTARLFGDLMDTLGDDLEAFQPNSPGRFAQHVVGLLSLMLTEGSQTADRSTLLEAAKDYIEHHLGDVDLTPSKVAASQYTSTRTLNRLFEEEGITIAVWIRQRRLENCRLDLLEHDLAVLPVSSIASRWGLRDSAYFSRIFKTTYGVSPREYRATVFGSGETRSA